MNTHRHIRSLPSAPARSRGPWILVCGLLFVFAGGPAVWAAFFPGDPPTVVFTDDFEDQVTGDIPAPWRWTNHAWTGKAKDLAKNSDWNIVAGAPPSCGAGGADGSWGNVHLVSLKGKIGSEEVLLVTDTIAGNPLELTNISIEVDIYAVDALNTRIGVVFGATAADTEGGDGVTDLITDGYLFYIGNIPTAADAVSNGSRATWHLVNRTGGSDVHIAGGPIELDKANNQWFLTLNQGECFRLRIDTFCGNLRAQVKRLDCSALGCTETNCDGDWCTIMTWTDAADLVNTPGAVGVYAGSDTDKDAKVWYDNFTVSSHGTDCDSICGFWEGWTENSREELQFKYLYEGALLDYSAGRVAIDAKIDVATTAPAVKASINLTDTNYCNGWRLLADLPAPTETTNFDAIKTLLELTSDSVALVNDGAGGLAWQDDFDNNVFLPDGVTPNPAYNPIPIVADGTTPINNSLLDAFDWYIEQVTSGDWADDPAKECRLWYVVLITDGVDSCASGVPPDGTGFACAAGQSASKFNDPGIAGVEAVPVYTIGFSEDANDAPEQLTCISDQTGGEYLGARNASELKDALYNVIDFLNTNKRSFSPFKVAPPPSSAGQPASQQDFLTVFPFFSPKREQSIWAGNLFGFRFNKDQPTIPVDDNCSVDVTQLIVEEVSGNVWDASARLKAQIAAHTEVKPKRYVFMGSDASGSWARHDLSTIPTNATLRTEFQTLLDEPGISTLTTQEVVNFVRGVWMDDDDKTTPDPQADARPAGWDALGDIFHSQPVILNPPNRSMFFFDYGLGDPAEAGAHDYALFMEQQGKRRRVVLVGANDGLLHAFDGGFWDRDKSKSDETYNEQHDLGDGTELFAYLPQTVMPRLYGMTFGTEQQYMVDGQTSVSDVFIDYDGDTDREWRTVAIATMRRGGRSMVALDVTQPDPIAAKTFIPDFSQFPGCIDGTTNGCDGEYPKVLWEFEDTNDDNANCPVGLSGAQCAPYWDLGWTWSKPAIARIAVYNSSTPEQPDDVFVAFFGGGWDQTGTDVTGNYFYGVDIATGSVVFKQNMFVSMPGSPTALDSDIDGFHDRIYFADSDGGIWRLEFPPPDDSAATGADAGTFTRIFDFRSDFPDRQRFFHRPVTVPALFDGNGYTWALALGSGDRAHTKTIDGDIDHFFFVLDVGDTTTRGATDLVAINYDELDGTFDCESSALNPAGGDYGWYLSLRPNEKVMFDATVVNGHVLFPTFDPTPDFTPSHNVPDECVVVDPDPDPDPEPEPDPEDVEVICRAAGNGRSYNMWFECGIGDYVENTDIYTGSEDYTIGGTTYVVFTESGVTPGETQEFPNVKGHVVTNWRQD